MVTYIINFKTSRHNGISILISNVKSILKNNTLIGIDIYAYKNNEI